MDGPCPGLAVFSESSKGPEEDRWKTPPDRSFDGRTPVGAEAWCRCGVRCEGAETRVNRDARRNYRAALLILRYKANCRRRHRREHSAAGCTVQC